MFRRILCVFTAAVVMLTALLATGVTAGAKTAISVNGTYSDGKYILQVYGLSKKQYTDFVNQKDGFRVNVISGNCSIFMAVTMVTKAEKPPIKGYKGEQDVYIGLRGNKIASDSKWSGLGTFSGLYGNAPGKSYGFRWELDAGDGIVRSFLPAFSRSPDVKVTFENAYTDSTKLAGGQAEYSVTADWGDAPLEAERVRNGVAVTIPTENYYKYEHTKGAELSLTLKFGKYTVNTVFSGGTSFVSTADLSGKDYIDNVTIKGKQTEHGGITLTYTLSDKAGRKALSSRPISAVYKVTSGGKIISGGKKSVQLLRGGRTALSALTVEEIPAIVYEGKKLEPQPILRDGYIKLIKNEDYTLSWKNNTSIGTGTIILKGKGAYKGTLKLEFSIIPKTPSFASRRTDDGVVLSWWLVSGVDRYEIERLDGDEFVKFMTITDGSYSVTLPSDTTGTFRIRAAAGDVVGEWSKEVTV